MKHINVFNNFPVKETVDISTSTLLYSDFILEETKEHFYKFIEGGEIESVIIHELNHGYEGYKRMTSGSGQLSVDVTWALDFNRSRIKKEI